MIEKEESSLYPYLPGYNGTIQEREKIIKDKLSELLKSLQLLEGEYGENKKDISLLVDIERCQVIVSELLD